ncbi:hypothetical protein [Prevotella jejuni]|uniref:hypothetical protein n=1 Tax=Prevotella jejuni TaxID=1177574 RepID=UPI003211ABC2
MKTMKNKTAISSMVQTACYAFAAVLLTASCANDDTTQNEKEQKTEVPAGTTAFNGFSQQGSATRTAIVNHTKGAGASVNWSNTDKIWVKDNAGTWNQSNAVAFATSNKAQGTFALNGTYSQATHDVVYTNKAIAAGAQPQVEIKSAQTQSAPNNFDHAGESGDCGIASATKNGNDYTFTLNHKAAYLCLIPRSSNPYVNRSKLIKVEITAEDDIAGTYTIGANGALTLASGGSKTITVTTGSGFAIDNSSDDMSKNATYAVVAPGNHKFRIRYWLRNTTDNPGGLIEGTVTRYVDVNCVAGIMTDVTANLTLNNYDGHNYYMWDAQQNYWYGHEWDSANPWQPFKNGNINSNYPQSKVSSPVRWYNDVFPGLNVAYQAQKPLFKALPNANEMAWYTMNSNPRWDNDNLWSTMGHLYKGGLWLKKKNKISGFNANNIPGSSVNLCTVYQTVSNSNVSEVLPNKNELNDFFYLPALGFYYLGKLENIGISGVYWTSTSESTEPGRSAYRFSFKKGSVFLGRNYRSYAFVVDEFK